MAEAIDISDIAQYNRRMAQSLMDKAFFIDKIDCDLIVDYGCADGALFKMIAQFLPTSVRLAGYDFDPRMVEIAKTNCYLENVVFYSNWEDVEKEKSKLKGGDKCAIVLNSVIHEIYEYLDLTGIDLFWRRVFDFDSVVIRDTVPSEKIDRKSDINDVRKVLTKFYGSKHLIDFQSRWGSIENNKQLVHFLLKYRYLEPNWDREVKENYLPLYWEKLLWMFPSDFNISYQERYCLPFLKSQVQKDFGIDIKDDTHLKIIFEKR